MECNPYFFKCTGEKNIRGLSAIIKKISLCWLPSNFLFDKNSYALRYFIFLYLRRFYDTDKAFRKYSENVSSINKALSLYYIIK